MGTKSSQALRKHPLLTGALLLTIAGLFSRLIGFFYRIYLARIFGEEGMGVYQLLSPVLSLSFSLTAAAYQTAISKFTAAMAARSMPACSVSDCSVSVHSTSAQRVSTFAPLLTGLLLSLPLSLLSTRCYGGKVNGSPFFFLWSPVRPFLYALSLFPFPLPAFMPVSMAFFMASKKLQFLQLHSLSNSFSGWDAPLGSLPFF